MRQSRTAAFQNVAAAVQAASHTARCPGSGSSGTKLRAGTSPPGKGAHSIGNMSYTGAGTNPFTPVCAAMGAESRAGHSTAGLKLKLAVCMSVLAINKPNQLMCWMVAISRSIQQAQRSQPRRQVRPVAAAVAQPGGVQRGQADQRTAAVQAVAVETFHLQQIAACRLHQLTVRCLHPRQAGNCLQCQVFTHQQVAPALHRGRAVGARKFHQHVHAWRRGAARAFTQCRELRQFAGGAEPGHTQGHGFVGEHCIAPRALVGADGLLHCQLGLLPGSKRSVAQDEMAAGVVAAAAHSVCGGHARQSAGWRPALAACGATWAR